MKFWSPALGVRFAVVQVRARSISRPVWEELDKAGQISQVGRVSAVFERACHLALCEREPIAVVSPEIGDGPLNIVLGEQPPGFPAVGAPVQVSFGREKLEMGWLQVGLDQAIIWEPCPEWDRLRARVATMRNRLPYLVALIRSVAPRESLVSILGSAAHDRWTSGQIPLPDAERGGKECIGSTVGDALRLLSVGWAGDGPELYMAASRLAGLGRGLTPSGDDFLVGVMIWAWLGKPEPERICGHLVAGSQQRTTALSAALLRAASRGECSRAWHYLLEVLYGHPDGELAAAVRAVLDFGHTSGADALAGFTWMGLHSRQT